ncbi:hypothetical protein COHA_009143 [Chlorella ohadii]|uniref:TauD/TfdA-like domain-containing protein n=1 Tax=Chlorella ohadii TaxID=2649997 RepID=A0AAD5DIL2_9CHLO|nr:hypothetical protein COHA_009143 [Chlorella ohadii]
MTPAIAAVQSAANAAAGSALCAATPFNRALSGGMASLPSFQLSSQLSLRLSSSGWVGTLITGPQGVVAPQTVVLDAAAWRAKDWAHRMHEAVVALGPGDVAAIKAAVAAFEASGADLSAIQKPEHFPLPASLTAKLAGVKRDLLHCRGFSLISGLPVCEWTERQCVAAYLGLSVHLGRPQPQSKDGKLVNHREHAHNLEFSVHTDAQADVLGLLCIRQAKEGGVSSFASCLAVHNELLRRGRADLVQCLSGPGWYRDRTRYQDVPEGADPVWDMPVFSYHSGYLTTHYNSSHYRLCAQKWPERCGLTPLQVEAMREFEAIATDPAFQISHRLAPGEIILLHNSSVLHARSAFKDGEAPEERRHLVRLWLGCADDRPQPVHLNFPRSYTTGYDRAAFEGLMAPAPSKFHVPLSLEADDL